MLEKFLLWSAKVYRFPRVVAAVVAAITVFFALFLPKLTFDNNLKNMLPKGSSDVAVNDYYEDESRFGSSSVLILGLESKDAYSLESLKYTKLIKDLILGLNKTLPAQNMAKKLGVTVEEAQTLIDALNAAGVTRADFATQFYPKLLDKEAIVATFGLKPELAEKVAAKTPAIEAKTFWDFSQRPIDSVASLVNSDYIAGADDTLVVEPLIDENALNADSPAQVKSRIDAWDIYKGLLVSQDGTLSSLLIKLAISDGSVSGFVDDAIQQILKDNPADGFKTYLDGEPVIANQLSQLMKTDVTFLLPLVVLVVLIILWLSFRSMAGVVYPLLVVLISVIWGLGIEAIFGVPLTIMGVAMPVLLVAIASAYGIHQMNHYLLDPDPSKLAILQKNMRSVGLAVTLSGLTVMIGFGALAIEDFVPMKNFGIFTAIGDFVAIGAALWLLPSLILLSKKNKTKQLKESDHGFIGGILKSFVKLNRKASGVVLIVAVVLGVGFAAGTVLVKAEMNNVSFFQKNSDIHVADDKLNEKLAGTQSLNIVLDSDLTDVSERIKGAGDGEVRDLLVPSVLNKIESFAQEVEKRYAIVGKVTSFNDSIKKMNKEMNGGDPGEYIVPQNPDLIAQYLLLFGGNLQSVVSSNHDKLIVRLTLKRASNSESEAIRQYALAYFDEQFRKAEHVQVQVTGAAHLYYVTNNLLVEGTYRSIIACVIVVFILLLYVLRSFVMSLIALIPIAITLAINYGILGFFGVPLNAGTAMVSSIAIGIGVDYSIHYITWYRNELRNKRDVILGIENSIMHKGRAILYNMFVIIGGFAILTASRFVLLQQFGILVSICMLATAFGALLVVPATLRLLAKKDRKFLYLGIAEEKN